jgi:DNA-directed RNA polymerase specialized sigma24 family protein
MPGAAAVMPCADPGRLVTAAAGGDQAAWQALVHQYSSLVWSITRAHRLGRADAADVFQTTWLRLAEHIHRIEQPSSAGAWLATAARRECLQVIRASGRTVPTEDSSVLDAAGPGTNPTEEAVLRAEALPAGPLSLRLHPVGGDPQAEVVTDWVTI